MSGKRCRLCQRRMNSDHAWWWTDRGATCSEGCARDLNRREYERRHGTGSITEPPGDQAELREQIVAVVAERGWGPVAQAEIADGVLALPALRSLLDDAARVQQVRKLADEYEGQHGQSWHSVVAQRIRRALDGGDRG